jgi:hypothetical protein
MTSTREIKKLSIDTGLCREYMLVKTLFDSILDAATDDL